MSTLELVLNMVPETTATEFPKEHQLETFEENVGTGSSDMDNGLCPMNHLVELIPFKNDKAVVY
ncbi:hypothetical protein AALA54_00755 [Oscillospiraceae bacterium 44-34]